MPMPVFGKIKMTWMKVIIMAVAAGVFTALMAMFVPDGNSFHEIAVHLEAWFLFALLIITNCETPLEAALKTFVFFLISQPLVYLIQVPFSSMGFGLFMYYRYWFMATLLTLPAAFIAWYVKKDNILSALILSAALVFLTLTGVTYLKDTMVFFPRHLVSTIFCFGSVVLFIFGILRSRTTRMIASAISLAALLGFGFIKLREPSFTFNTLVDLDPIKYPLDDSWSVTAEDERISKAMLLDLGDETVLEMIFYEDKPNKVTLTDGEGNEYVITVTISKDQEVTVEE